MGTAPPCRVFALADHLGHEGGRVHGATTYYVNVYPALRRAGIELTAAFLSCPHPAADLLRAQGIEPVFLSARKWDFAVIGRLMKLIEQTRPDILHLAAFKSHFLGRLAAGRHACRTIVHLHDTVPLLPHVKLAQLAVRRRTDLALAVSSPVGELGVREYGLPASIIRTLHNAIDVDRFTRQSPGARATTPETSPSLAM